MTSLFTKQNNFSLVKIQRTCGKNTVGKGEIAHIKQFLLFLHLGELTTIFIKLKIVVCKLFQFGKS